jgi:hypothetical protein
MIAPDVGDYQRRPEYLALTLRTLVASKSNIEYEPGGEHVGPRDQLEDFQADRSECLAAHRNHVLEAAVVLCGLPRAGFAF